VPLLLALDERHPLVRVIEDDAEGLEKLHADVPLTYSSPKGP